MSDHDATVLVTGATGFIGMHCIVQLLEQGWRVRGTLRGLRERGEALRRRLSAHVDLHGRLELVEVELTSDTGWDEAVAGCRFVLHVASPLPDTPPDHEEELILPAREGALRALRAAARAGVERVVLTSSAAAVFSGRNDARPFTEQDWSSTDRSSAYARSKTFAERAAWDFVSQQQESGRLELVAINPGVVLGPVLGDTCPTSLELVRRIMAGKVPGCADIALSVVDVRDVAAVHILAMTAAGAAGMRFLCGIEPVAMVMLATILRRHFGARGYRITTRRIPSALVRLYALFDRQTRLIVDELGQRKELDTSRARDLLGWQPRGLEEVVVATGESLIQRGLV